MATLFPTCRPGKAWGFLDWKGFPWQLVAQGQVSGLLPPAKVCSPPLVAAARRSPRARSPPRSGFPARGPLLSLGRGRRLRGRAASHPGIRSARHEYPHPGDFPARGNAESPYCKDARPGCEDGVRANRTCVWSRHRAPRQALPPWLPSEARSSDMGRRKGRKDG